MKYLEVSYISANFALRKFIDKVDDDTKRALCALAVRRSVPLVLRLEF